ncbi:tubulin-dependent ATPase kip3 [Cryptotrichosporon argae]
MTTSSIQVAVRVRPFTESETLQLSQPEQRTFFLSDQFQSTPRRGGGSLRNVVDIVDDRTLVFDPPPPRPLRNAPRPKNRSYTFDAVIPTVATQEEVFYSTAEPLIEPVLNGINSTVFAYGATGCGKTFTISGTPEDPGVIVRTMERLFERIEEDKDRYRTYVKLSMVEIYNEVIRDLLTDNHPTGPAGGLKLLENEAGKVTIAGVEYHEPQSAEEVMELVLRGNERRSTSYTASNAVSSRSHSILQVYVGRESRQQVVDASGKLASPSTTAVLSIIDLAGSERAAATSNMGQRQIEGAKINKSLLALNGVMAALSLPQRGSARRHVNFRDSKLTRLLKFSLQGNCRTVVIVCISPSSAHIEESNNTLTWASRASKVQTTVSRNTGAEPVTARQYVTRIQDLNEQVAQLTARLKTLDDMQQAAPDHAANRAKVEAERRAVQALFKQAKDERDRQLPYILAGAEARARRDAADIAAASLKRGIDAVDAPEDKAHFQQLVAKQDGAFRARGVQAAIETEQTAKFSIEQVVRRTQVRSSYSALTPVDEANIQLQVDAHHHQIELAVAGAREKALRETVAGQADAVVKAQAAVLRQVARTRQIEAGIGKLLLAIGPHSPEVGDILATLRTTVATAAAESISQDIIVAAGPVPALPALSALSQTAIAVHSPAIKRRLDMTLGASLNGSIAAALFSPAPAATAQFAATAAPAVAKALRWPDMAGEGALSTVKTISAPTSVASDTSLSSVPDSLDTSRTHSPPGLLPPRTSRFSALPSPLSATVPAPAPAPASTDAGASANDWRANRALMGRALPAVAEDVFSAGPDKPAPTALAPAPLGLGPPARAQPPQPLAPLHRLPAASNTSVSLSTAPLGALGIGKPSTAASARTRRPSIGPDRAKLRPRDSSMPYAAGPKRVGSAAGRPAGSADSSPEDRPGPLVSLAARPLGQVPRPRPSVAAAGAGSTLTLPTASSARRTSEIPIARRQSILGLAAYAAAAGTVRSVQAGGEGRPMWK